MNARRLASQMTNGANDGPLRVSAPATASTRRNERGRNRPKPEKSTKLTPIFPLMTVWSQLECCRAGAEGEGGLPGARATAWQASTILSKAKQANPCRFSNLCLLDKRMQRLNRGFPVLHGDKQTDRMRRQHVVVGDNPVLSENLQRLERQFGRNAAEAGETDRA